MGSMKSDGHRRLRITIWPGNPLPIPCYQHSRSQLAQARNALFCDRGGGELVDSHGEIYLELANLNLADPDAIAGFADKYSVLGGEELYRRLRDAGRFRNPYRRGRNTFPREQRLEHEHARSELIGRDDLSLYRTEIETLHAFRFAAIVFRGMAWDWQQISTGSAPTAQDARPLIVAGGLLYTPSVTDLPSLLSNYTPMLSISRSADVSETGTSHAPEIIAASPETSAPLFEVCAFELFNHIARSDIYRQCENESCGRLFVRQHGRAEHGQSRSQGIKYCTHQCAQAQTQRMYRRRKARRTHPSSDQAATS
jgi:hypothetical protein